MVDSTSQGSEMGMPVDQKGSIAALLAEADQMTDPRTCGLVDGTDCQVMLSKLTQAVRELLEAEEQAEREREELLIRLSRGLHFPA